MLVQNTIDRIGNRQVVGVAGGRRTAFNLHERRRRIRGQIRKQRQDGHWEKGFDWFAVWYNPDMKRRHLIDPDTSTDNYHPKF